MHIVGDREKNYIISFNFFLADMLLHMVASMVADMADGMVADMTADNLFSFFLGWKKFLADMDLDIGADKEVDKLADMVVGHWCWLIGPKFFWPEPLRIGSKK